MSNMDIKKLWPSFVKTLGSVAADSLIYNKDISIKHLINSSAGWLIVDFIAGDIVKNIIKMSAQQQSIFVSNVAADSLTSYAVDMVLSMPTRKFIEYFTLAISGESAFMLIDMVKA